MSLERIKDLFNIRLMFKKVYPAKSRVVIHKTDIILIPPSPRRNTNRPPNIGVNQLKRLSGNTRRQ
jgi:hypothetical protein